MVMRFCAVANLSRIRNVQRSEELQPSPSRIGDIVGAPRNQCRYRDATRTTLPRQRALRLVRTATWGLLRSTRSREVEEKFG